MKRSLSINFYLLLSLPPPSFFPSLQTLFPLWLPCFSPSLLLLLVPFHSILIGHLYSMMDSAWCGRRDAIIRAAPSTVGKMNGSSTAYSIYTGGWIIQLCLGRSVIYSGQWWLISWVWRAHQVDKAKAFMIGRGNSTNGSTEVRNIFPPSLHMYLLSRSQRCSTKQERWYPPPCSRTTHLLVVEWHVICWDQHVSNVSKDTPVPTKHFTQCSGNVAISVFPPAGDSQCTISQSRPWEALHQETCYLHLLSISQMRLSRGALF